MFVADGEKKAFILSQEDIPGAKLPPYYEITLLISNFKMVALSIQSIHRSFAVAVRTQSLARFVTGQFLKRKFQRNFHWGFVMLGWVQLKVYKKMCSLYDSYTLTFAVLGI